MKRVLLTGATGFIGQQCLPLLSARGYEVHAVSSKPRQEIASGLYWHQADLLDSRQISALNARVRPSHLLYFAWYLVPGKYTTATENLLWVQASLELLRRFYEYGGSRAVIAGSCFEYDLNYGFCSEFRTPKEPNTFYGTCKNALRMLMDAYSAATDLSCAWGRIFFLYGPNEHQARLVSSVICSLLRREPARCSHGNQIRDYLHVQDAASAFIALLDSNVRGQVNIASGHPTVLKELIYKIALKLSCEDLIRLGEVPPASNDYPLVIADVGRLSKEVGWQPKYDLDQGLEHTIGWWKNHMDGNERERWQRS